LISNRGAAAADAACRLPRPAVLVRAAGHAVGPINARRGQTPTAKLTLKVN
jgi:hypothetical protein